ncbi:MAG: 30S ribosomal protein S1 [Alphaproteobacteria bacterium]|nr:30S ribosomal protein S1 [Alphaproteobacteria bacterium]
MANTSGPVAGHDAGAGAPAEDFAALLEESLDGISKFEGQVVKGRIIAIENDVALVDVGLKSEGRIPVREFSVQDTDPKVIVGDEVEVFVERLENANGEAVLSREKARREEAWTQLEEAFKDTARVTGIIFGRVKGGFTVDLQGAVAFLPGSQVDIRPVRDVGPLMGSPQPFQILKMDRQRGNIVVSRRAVLEETRAEERAELIANLKEGQVLQGVVKNITDYGAFVDLGGIDGLLHVTDISWKRVNHPTDALQVGQTVDVQVIRFNPETQRISLGMKQLEVDPWDGVAAKYPLHARFTGRVTNITDYGAFVELEAGVEGLVHVSEMSWTKKNFHPGKIISTSQEVEVMVLDVDPQRRRISLGLKQCMDNPWGSFAENNPVGAEMEGEIKNITEFGLFVGLPGDIDGMVHMSDIAWGKPGDEAIAAFTKGDNVKFKVLDIDTDKERISLGIKQLTEDPFTGAVDTLKKGVIVTCTVAAVTTGGIEVKINDRVTGFIRKTELSRERSEQRPDRFAVGEKVDAKITAIDAKTRKVTLTIKGREVEEDKKAMAEYGSSDSGARLGDILGAAMDKAKAKAETKPKTSEKKAAAKKAESTKAEAKKAEAEKPAKKAATKKAEPKKADDAKVAKAAPAKKAAAKKTPAKEAKAKKDE